jgi:hypothetical protein
MALSDEIHDKLTNDDTSDAGDEDVIGSGQDVPRSFTLILISSFLTKLGDAIASPKTTLAWVSTAVGAPAYVLGFLVPLRESGSMIPQLFIGGAIRQLPVRKWVWVLGSCGQFLCIVGLGLTAWLLEGKAAGWMMLLLITLFSLARGFSSVASKDVLGKTIPKKQRGQLTGWATSAAGLLSIAVGVVLLLPVTGRLDESLLGVLLVGAGLLWLVAAAVYSRVPEPVGETGGGRNALEALRRLNILVSDKPFRRFVITRALLMCSALSAPFYVALAQQNYGSRCVRDFCRGCESRECAVLGTLCRCVQQARDDCGGAGYIVGWPGDAADQYTVSGSEWNGVVLAVGLLRADGGAQWRTRGPQNVRR